MIHLIVPRQLDSSTPEQMGDHILEGGGKMDLDAFPDVFGYFFEFPPVVFRQDQLPDARPAGRYLLAAFFLCYGSLLLGSSICSGYNTPKEENLIGLWFIEA